MAKTIETLKAEIAERQAELKTLQDLQNLSDSEMDEIINRASR